MPLSYGGAGTGQINGGGSTSSMSESITTSGANVGLLVITRTQFGTSGSNLGLHWNGAQMTKLHEDTSGSGFLTWFYLANAHAGTANLTMTWNFGSSGTNASYAYAFYNGAAATLIDVEAQSSSTSSGTITASLTTTIDNCWLVLLMENTSGGTTAGTATTERAEANNLVVLDSNGAKTPAGSHSLQFTNSLTNLKTWTVFAIAPLTSTAYDETYTETLTLTESLLKQGQKVLADAISAADTILKRAGKVLSETPTITDIFAGLRVKIATLSETLVFADGDFLRNGTFESAPALIAPTTSAGRFIDGTAAGSASDRSFGAWAIPSSAIAASASANFDSTVSHAGSNSMKLDLLNVTGIVVVSQGLSGTSPAQQDVVPVAPNTAYTITGFAKTQNVRPNAVFIDAREFNSSLATVTTTSSGKLSGTNDWTLLTINLTTAPSTRYIQLILRNGVAGNISTAWFDDLAITQNGFASRTYLLLRTLSENPTLTDTIPRSIQRFLSEAATITDSLLKLPGKFLSEAVSVVDTVLRAFTRTLSETATLTESILKSAARTLSQTLTVADTFTRLITYIRTFTEGFTITEFIKSYLNGLNSRYSRKYEDQGTTYTEKYPAKGTQYEKKYPS